MPKNTKDAKMEAGDALSLQAQAEEVQLHDHLIGSVLLDIVRHLAAAHGLDVAEEQDKANQAADEQAQAEAQAQQEEAAKVQAEQQAAVAPSEAPSAQEGAQ